MGETITKTSGKILFINGDEISFNSLTEMMDIIYNHKKNTPEYITVYGLSSEEKKYQLGLDFNMLTETRIDLETIRFSRFQKFLGEILVEKEYLSKETLQGILQEQRSSTHNERIGELLIRRGMVTSEQIVQALTEQATQKK